MTNKNKVIIDYKEKVTYHCKRKMNNFKLQYNAGFTTWEEVYNYVKELTKSTKREWIEDKIDCRLVLWDTDLEPEEQYCVDYMLEFFNYEQGSFELEELREILAENTDEENLVMTCDTLINALIRHGKETIETE